jgi:hypothetical protein
LAEAELDPVGPQSLGETVPKLLGLAGEDVVRALHKRDRGSHARQRLAHLHTDRSAPENEQAARDVGQRSGLAVGPHSIELV